MGVVYTFPSPFPPLPPVLEPCQQLQLEEKTVVVLVK